jgi:hypothetical protein
MAMRSSSRVAHRCRFKTFFSTSAKNDARAALSLAAPTSPWSRHAGAVH